MKNYYLYLYHQVQICLKNGDLIEGELQEISADSLLLSGCTYLLDDIADLRHLGLLTEYDPSTRKGRIDSVYECVLPETKDHPPLCPTTYREHEYTVSCHLMLQNRKIYAADVEITSYRHLMQTDILSEDDFLYFFCDRTCKVGKLISPENPALLFEQQRFPIRLSDVCDITRLPSVNDKVSVLGKDKLSRTGIVTAVKDSFFSLLCPDGLFPIDYENILSLRYYGRITDSSGSIDERYRFEGPSYFHEDSRTSAVEIDAEVSYIVGINDHFLIAKDIRLHSDSLEETAVKEQLGIILHIDTSHQKGVGYIGSEFTVKSLDSSEGQKKGSIVFYRHQMPFSYVNRYIYVVKYTTLPKKNNEPFFLLDTMEYLEKYEYDRYSVVRINPDNQIEAVPIFQAKIDKYRQKNVLVYCKDSSIHSGVLTGDDPQQIFLQTQDGNVSLLFAEIEQIRILGTVTTYLSNGTGWIDKYFFFHIHSLRHVYNIQDLREGGRVSFLLRNTGKGNGIDCTDIEVLPEEEALLTAWDGEQVCLVSKEEYRTAKGSFRLLENSSEFSLDTLDLKRFDYPVHYMPNENGTSIRLTEIGAPQPKVFFGYIENYYNYSGKKFGFIIPEQYFDDPDRERSVTDVYCSAASIGESETSMDTFNHFYYVSYTLNHLVSGIKEPAESVHLIEARKKTQKSPAVKETGDSTSNPLPLSAHQVPDFVPGESFFVMSENGQYLLEEYASSDDDQIRTKQDTRIDPKENRIHRFAVLTDFDKDFQTGRLNGLLQFPFSLMETKTLNLVKSAGKKILLSYIFDRDQLLQVERVPQEVLALMRWKKGRVTKTSFTENQRLLTIDAKVKHYLSVLSDGPVNKKAADKKILRKELYYREVRCPQWNANASISLQTIAADVHLTSETALIDYDFVQDRYLAYRNNSYYFPIEGDTFVLSSLVQQETLVSFAPEPNPYFLKAYLPSSADDSGKPSIVRQISNTPASLPKHGAKLSETDLGRFCLQSVDLRKIPLPSSLAVSSETHFVSPDQAFSIFEFLSRKTSRLSSAEWFALADLSEQMNGEQRSSLRKSNRPTDRQKLLRSGFRKKIQEIAWDPDALSDEYSYFQSEILKDSTQKIDICDNLYRLLLPNFYNRIDFAEKLQQLHTGRTKAKIEDLRDLFQRNCLNENARSILSHLVTLNEQSVDLLLSNKILTEDPILYKSFAEFTRRIDPSDFFENIHPLLLHLRNVYRQDKQRFQEKIGQISADFCSRIADLLHAATRRFFLFLGNEDARRLEFIAKLCRNIEENRYLGFLSYEQALRDGYRQITNFQRELAEHPTREAIELLWIHQIPDKIRQEIASELHYLYQREEYYPEIRCFPNEYEINGNERTLTLIIQNSSKRSQDIQTARDAVLYLECFELGNDGIEQEIKLRDTDLKPGLRYSVDVKVDPAALNIDRFDVYWRVEYNCYDGFDEVPTRRKKIQEGSEPMHFQKKSADRFFKDPNAANPYREPAIGRPLENDSMFFGRKQEIHDIWSHFIDDREEMLPGQAVIVYGQKKCGKTSLINQIKNKIADTPKVREQAIIIDFDNILETNGGATGLKHFNLNFYANILDKFDDAVYTNHKDVLQMMEENGLDIPDIIDTPESAAFRFQRFFKDFKKYDQGRHKILLIMDEFTLLCTRILVDLDKHPEYQGIPNFIKMLSGMGFIQIIIGHAAMMRALATLGIINHTAEFTKKIELSALKESDAADLVRLPMQKSFGFDVYSTPLGENAVDYLLDLAGCSPSVLMRLCDQMFRFYIETIDGPQIKKPEAEKMVAEYINRLDMSTFDLLLTEDGDEGGYFEERPSYLYLKNIAAESCRSFDHRCPFETPTPELSETKNSEIRETLLDRKVLCVEDGRIWIRMRLFVEYLRNKYGF